MEPDRTSSLLVRLRPWLRALAQTRRHGRVMPPLARRRSRNRSRPGTQRLTYCRGRALACTNAPGQPRQIDKAEKEIRSCERTFDASISMRRARRDRSNSTFPPKNSFPRAGKPGTGLTQRCDRSAGASGRMPAKQAPGIPSPRRDRTALLPHPRQRAGSGGEAPTPPCAAEPQRPSRSTDQDEARELALTVRSVTARSPA